MGHQLRLTRQLITRAQALPAYRSPQVIGYLPEDGTITGRVDSLGEHTAGAQIRNSSTRAHVYAC
jgi:hypothetical protein